MLLLQFAKLSWMFLWRLLLISFLTRMDLNVGVIAAISLGAAASLVFGLNRTVIAWPLLRGIFRRTSVIIPASPTGRGLFARARDMSSASSGGHVVADALVSSETRAWLEILDTREVIERASAEGTVTGYEPRTLRALPVPRGPFMVGVPGEGLRSAKGLGEQQVRAGVKGEENFAKALALFGLLDRFQTIWSMRVIDAEELKIARYAADIDCVIPTAVGLLLIDLKLYTSGAVRYRSRDRLLYVEDIGTGDLVGEPVPLSPNMRDAAQAIRNHFPEIAVVPIVVFMPSDRGQGQLIDVHWPGAVPARSITDFLSWLATLSAPDPTHPVARAADRLIRLP